MTTPEPFTDVNDRQCDDQSQHDEHEWPDKLEPHMGFVPFFRCRGRRAHSSTMIGRDHDKEQGR